jgi:hypothetical protein
MAPLVGYWIPPSELGTGDAGAAMLEWCRVPEGEG